MQLDRLLSRIRAALQDYATDFEQRALAAEYVEWCARAARRLEQIVPLIREGQAFPALQIAETPPPVLDLVRQLAFADAERWRAHCQKRGLPTAEPFDEQAVELVHQLYGKRIGETHPLYRDYRAAMRARREQDALRVLQSIRRINTDDANAHAEFNRLAQKLFVRKRADLEAALAQKDVPHVLALMDAIAEDGWSGHEQDAVWQRAAEVRAAHRAAEAAARCREIARALAALHAEEKWEETLPLLAEWDDLQSEFEPKLPPDVAASADAVRNWAAARLDVREREAEAARLWRDLAERLDETAVSPPDGLSGKALAAELSDWQKREIEWSARQTSPPEALASRLSARLAALRATASRRRVTRAAVAAAACLALLAGASAFFWIKSRADFRDAKIAQFEQLMVTENDSLLATEIQTIDDKYQYLTSDGQFGPVLERARTYLANQEAARNAVLDQLARLDTAAGGDPAPAHLAAMIEELATLDPQASALGPVAGPPLQAQIASRRLAWTQALAGATEAREQRVTSWAARAAQLQLALPSSPGQADAAGALPPARALLAEVAQLPASPETDTPAERAARARLDDFAQRVAALDAALIALREARAELPQARTLATYRVPLDSLAANPLTGEPDVAAARALAELAVNWDAVAQQILLPGQPEVWASLAAGDPGRLRPAASAQGEDIAFSRLVQNEMLANVHTAELIEFQEGLAKSRQPVFLAGPLTENNLRFGENRENEEIMRTGMVINRDGTLTKTDTRLIKFRNNPGNGKLFENARLTPESRLLQRVNQAYDARSGSIREPLLRVLDDIRADPDASPIYKAYLQQELLKIMQARAGEWGLAYSPTAQTDGVELARITGGGLQPYDWLFPGNPRLVGDLAAFYNRTSSTKYYDGALREISRLLGLRATLVEYAGYVDASGAPVVATPPPAGAALWGLGADGVWRALYKSGEGAPSAVPGAPAPARLTPLLVPRDSAASVASP